MSCPQESSAPAPFANRTTVRRSCSTWSRIPAAPGRAHARVGGTTPRGLRRVSGQLSLQRFGSLLSCLLVRKVSCLPPFVLDSFLAGYRGSRLPWHLRSSIHWSPTKTRALLGSPAYGPSFSDRLTTITRYSRNRRTCERHDFGRTQFPCRSVVPGGSLVLLPYHPRMCVTAELRHCPPASQAFVLWACILFKHPHCLECPFSSPHLKSAGRSNS